VSAPARCYAAAKYAWRPAGHFDSVLNHDYLIPFARVAKAKAPSPVRPMIRRRCTLGVAYKSPFFKGYTSSL
jgi:hypothetical protein